MNKSIIFSVLFFIYSYNISSQVWDSVPEKILAGEIHSLYVHNDKLYIGGSYCFVSDPGNTLYFLSTWDGTGWNNKGGGPYTTAHDIKYYNNEIYIGGTFCEVGGVATNNQIARWDGANWHPVGTGYIDPYATSEINDMEVFNGELYVIGEFYQIDVPYGQETGIEVWDLAKWDGSAWHKVWNYGEELTYAKLNQALTIYNGELIVGGRLTLTTPEGTAHNIASWDGSQWKPLGGGISDLVADMIVDTINNFLYVGGAFLYAEGILVNGIAKWDGYEWSAIGTELPHGARALAMYHNELYAGSVADAGVYNSIFRWNGTNWEVVGGGTNNCVLALEVYHDTLFVGGYFDTAGVISARRIAKWYSPPDTTCNYLMPTIHSDKDTVYSIDTATVQFYNNNAYVDSWQWDFGDTGTDTIQNPVHTYTDTGTYNASVTVRHNTCIKAATKTITILDNTGIKDINIKELGFKLYPNPTDNSFFIEAYIAADNKGIIKIYGLKGELLKELVLKKGSNKTMVHTSGWRNGIYICNLIINGKIIKSEKMVLAR